MNTLTGIVQQGQKRGKILGYPTANIICDAAILQGIFISYTVVGTKKYPSITFIGASHTFNETNIECETYIFDFSQNIYGKKITIELIQKIRNNRKFNSGDALVRQMDKDVRIAKQYFASKQVVSSA